MFSVEEIENGNLFVDELNIILDYLYEHRIDRKSVVKSFMVICSELNFTKESFRKLILIMIENGFVSRNEENSNLLEALNLIELEIFNLTQAGIEKKESGGYIDKLTLRLKEKEAKEKAERKRKFEKEEKRKKRFEKIDELKKIHWFFAVFIVGIITVFYFIIALLFDFIWDIDINEEIKTLYNDIKTKFSK